MSVVDSYRESRLGRAHVHLARFVAGWVVLTVTSALGMASGFLATGIAGPSPQLVTATLFFAGVGSWLPALIVPVALARGDRRGD